MSIMWTQSETPSNKIATPAPTPYRCYLMDEIGHILALTVVKCADEASAIREAAMKLRVDPECRIIEVWEIGRRIARLRLSEITAAAA
jgi:hypothetical protein